MMVNPNVDSYNLKSPEKNPKNAKSNNLLKTKRIP